MIEGLLLFLIGIGALLVSVVSIPRMAWLAVIIPTLIAGGAAYVLFVLGGRPRRMNQPVKRTDSNSEKSRRMAA